MLGGVLNLLRKLGLVFLETSDPTPQLLDDILLLANLLLQGVLLGNGVL